MDSKVVLKEKNPYDKANIFSKIFLWWSFKLFKTGYKKSLSLDDLWQARSVDLSGRLGDRLEEAWEREVELSRKNSTPPSLSRAIVRCFWVEYMTCGIFVAILFILIWPMIPFTLALFIEYFAGEKTAENYRNAHIHNFILNFLSITSALMLNHITLAQSCVGMRVRIASCSLIYRKILKLNRAGLSKTESGQVINLMSNDVNRFDMASAYLNYLWVMPIVVPVVSYLIWQHIGYATFAALIVIFLQTVTVQVYLSNRQGALRGKIAKRTDERVKVMSELVNGVQVIKMYAWEKPFEKLVDKLRNHEVKFIQRTSFIKGFATALSVFTERFILFSAVVTFVLIGGEITTGITFSLVQYYNLMQLACNIFFPMALALLAESKVSVRRLEEFLTLDELETENPKIEVVSLNGTVKESEKSQLKPTGLVISNVCASWLPNSIIQTLSNLSLLVQPGEFVGVAGLVGSGKSSLLQLILGELRPSHGSVSLGGARLSYASQEPWLFVATIRQNILFGLPYDRLRYNKVVAACALLRDFKQLPSGDATMVGERGISLSGGQRARIGLARACYRNADVYLLDDPLSAVDTHVGKHLVSECVMGLLRHSTRILVTHQLHHLKQADKVIILRNGEVETTGSFEEVSKSSLFKELEEEEISTDDASHPELLRKRTISIQSQSSADTTAESMHEEQDEPDESTELMEKAESRRELRAAALWARREVGGGGGRGEDVVLSPEVSYRSSSTNTCTTPLETSRAHSDKIQRRVSSSVYQKYFRAGGSWCLLLTTTVSILLAQIVTSFSDLWLTHWMNNLEEIRPKHALLEPYANENLTSNVSDLNAQNDTFTTESTLNLESTSLPTNLSVIGTIVKTALVMQDIASEEPAQHSFYIYIWGAAILGCIVLTTGRSIMFLFVCMKSSINMHNQMFSNILSATMRFFDTNPSGRILNRFSKDMGIIDEILPKMYLDSIQILLVMIGILVMVAIVSPYMMLTTLFCGIFMYIWTVIFLATAQAIKRLEGVSRSPVFSHVSASMAGLVTVRACGNTRLLQTHFDDKQDVHTAAWYLTLITNTAFAVWLSLISSLYVVVVAYTFLLMDDGTTKSGNVGLAISQGLILVNMVQYGIKQVTEVISQMTSVERVLQFTKLPQEVTDGPSPPKSWPQRAKLVFKDLYLRYDREAEPVLKNLNIVIESGWKVGVVGRTGAGKSSLISALFRLAPIEGGVFIDDIDTGEIALKELRAKISIIPQEPVLFSASLRYNLDPFDKYTDADIWNALEQVELKNSVSSLSAAVEAGGVNFSAGQRQLLCLARAALARNKLLVLDEATANVDPNTDALIQESIRRHFRSCTVLTVAHRLHTVADSDRVVVMEAGQIVECGHPHELLQKKEGHFTSMVSQLGPASEQSLREHARTAFHQHIRYADDEPPAP